MSRLLLNQQPLVIDYEQQLVIDRYLAQVIGLEESIVITKINYLIEVNKEAIYPVK